MRAYYNEFDPKVAAWLRELIKRGLIADGDVDERSIIEVEPGDIRGYQQCHFFAGIGGWSYALRLAGVPDDYPVWTASLPCQPFSVAGKQLGNDDERHLLPHFIELVRQSKPQRLFGEQVTGAIRHGWLDDLQAAMEAENYAVGAAVLGAHSVGSHHQRQRLYWVADSDDTRSQGRELLRECANQFVIRADGLAGGVASSEPRSVGNTELHGCNADDVRRGVGDSEAEGRLLKPERSSRLERMGNTELHGCNGGQVASSDVYAGEEWGSQESVIPPEPARAGQTGNAGVLSAGETGCGEWDYPDWIYCRDNKFRPAKPGIQPLVDGIPRGMVYSGGDFDPDATSFARVVRLKGYGNAIVPQVAAEFISAFMDARSERR